MPDTVVRHTLTLRNEPHDTAAHDHRCSQATDYARLSCACGLDTRIPRSEVPGALREHAQGA